ncbi:MAG: polysaccharide deacetylase family protein [Gammaproteobacteria bacterium]
MLKKAVAMGLYYSGAWNAYFGLKRYWQGAGAAVLNFHRLLDDAEGLPFKGPTVQTPVRLFEDVMAMLAGYYAVVPLHEIVEHLVAREPFARDSIAVTFDDGYEDNLRLGLPILARYRIPATIFLATAFIDHAEVLWTERLEQALRTTCKDFVDVERLGLSYREPRLPLSTPEQRRQGNRVLGDLLKGHDAEGISRALKQLESQLEVDPRGYAQRMLTWPQVRELDAAGIEIGAHGVSHTIMTRLDFSSACAEMRLSKAAIESKLQRPVRHFAFPNGRAEDFSEPLRLAARDLGYQSVSSCVWGLNWPGRESPYDIRRIGLSGDSAQMLLPTLERLFRTGRADYPTRVPAPASRSPDTGGGEEL